VNAAVEPFAPAYFGRNGSRSRPAAAAAVAFTLAALATRTALACPFCGGYGAGETASSWLVIGAVIFFIARAIRSRK
jgi:hypothetical protein